MYRFTNMYNIHTYIRVYKAHVQYTVYTYSPVVFSKEYIGFIGENSIPN